MDLSRLTSGPTYLPYRVTPHLPYPLYLLILFKRLGWLDGRTNPVIPRRLTSSNLQIPMQEIKVRFEATDLAALNHQAAAAGTSRAALIRDRALRRLTTTEYHALVADAVAVTHGNLPRLQVEYLVAYVITRLDQHPSQTVAGHQPTP